MAKLKIIYRGAEAEIVRSTYFGRDVVEKHRIQKGYRLPEIDARLRRHRTREEAKLMLEARKAGVSVPIVYDVRENTITMEYLKGKRVKELLPELSKVERKKLCYTIGEAIARLHNRNIIHGDITTSNLIYVNGMVHFIDFGLGEINSEIEAKGVDLHLLMEALSSAHSRYPDCFKYVFEGYKNTFNGSVKEIKRKIEAIIKRGRYQ
jgi:TP53 regulating kinase-like protein